jgi:hypothetical protein
MTLWSGENSRTRPFIAARARRIEARELPIRLIIAAAMGCAAALGWCAWAVMAFVASS